MNIGKPVTEKMKEKANKLYLFLKTRDDYVTKEEIGAYLGVSNERSVRDIISTLAKRKPIISKSNSTGYKLAQTKQDLKEVENVWAELDSRISDMNERKKPLIRFYDKIKYPEYYNTMTSDDDDITATKKQIQAVLWKYVRKNNFIIDNQNIDYLLQEIFKEIGNIK